MYTLGCSPKGACAACKFQRRKCTADCALAPWFPSDQPKRFANVHRLFGVSNVLKLLNIVTNRAQTEDLVTSIVYEADAREKDPVHGAYGNLRRLVRTEIELEREREKLCNIYEAMLLEAEAKHASAPVSQAAVYPFPSSSVTQLNPLQQGNGRSMAVQSVPPFFEYPSGSSTAGPIWDLGIQSVPTSSKYPQQQAAADNVLPLYTCPRPLYTYGGNLDTNGCAQQMSAPLDLQQQRFSSAPRLQLHSETTAEGTSTVIRSKSETPLPVWDFFSQGLRNSPSSLSLM